MSEHVAVSPPVAAAPALRVPISVLIPTLNEGKNLAACLDHLRWADEVVIIDSGSTDATLAIAQNFGAKIIDFSWNGQWPKKRNWALRNAPLKHEWILMVDADEWIVPELATEIADAIRSDEMCGYWINRKFMFMGQWLRHCGYYPSWNLRLIKRGHGEFEQLSDIGDTGSGDMEVHEHVVAKGPVGHLKADMLHFAYPTISAFVEKHNRYSNWEAAVQLSKSTPGATHLSEKTIGLRRRLKTLSRRLPFRPTLRFFYSFILQQGFRDGRAGYIFCRLLAMYEFLSVAKYVEAKRQQRLSTAPE